MENDVEIRLTVNGEEIQALVAPRLSLVDFLRDHLRLTGSHVGCEHGVCGACTIRLNDRIVRGCLTLAVQADGRAVETIEGLDQSNEIRDLQDAFIARNALQCGFCTPGVLTAAAQFLRDCPTTDRVAIRRYLSGNYCRCTGYEAIVDAVQSVVRNRELAVAADHE
ncbi:MAG: (2Fe-2S)-binding protein [Alphaproteobacteria bacterium]